MSETKIIESETPSAVVGAARGSAARTPATVFPVGSFILDEMQERGWSIEELGRRMGCDIRDELAVELLIHAPTKGATLGEHTAKLLAKAFGTSKELWLKLDETWQQNVPDEPPATGDSRIPKDL